MYCMSWFEPRPIIGIRPDFDPTLGQPCPICYADLEKHNSIKYPCGHRFHEKCYENYRQYVINNQKLLNCPTCEKQLFGWKPAYEKTFGISNAEWESWNDMIYDMMYVHHSRGVTPNEQVLRDIVTRYGIDIATSLDNMIRRPDLIYFSIPDKRQQYAEWLPDFERRKSQNERWGFRGRGGKTKRRRRRNKRKTTRRRLRTKH